MLIPVVVFAGEVFGDFFGDFDFTEDEEEKHYNGGGGNGESGKVDAD